MLRWIAAPVCVASLLALPGMAQQDSPAPTAPAPSELPAEEAGEPFEPLFMLDEDGRLVLIGPYGETELDVINPVQRGTWRAKLSRKIEVLIRAGAKVDASTYLELIDPLADEPVHKTRFRAHAKHPKAPHHAERFGAHLRRLRMRHCGRVLKRLGLDGDEVRAVRPLLEQVLRARRALGVGDWRARRALRHVETPPAARDALATFRSGKREREARLSAARKRLREVVTVKQEALLVAQGILD